jgi:phosphoribosylpyrophosphate synthetase
VRALDRPDRKLVEVLLAADALRRAGARSVALVAPYLPYLRQDAVSRRLARAGVARLVSCDGLAHPSNAIPIAPLVAAHLRGRLRVPD